MRSPALSPLRLPLALALALVAPSWSTAGEPQAPFGRVLFLGNSITRHPPAPANGWHGDWGMAASVAERDYVHRVLDALAKQSGKRPEFMATNIADFERGHATYDVEARLRRELEFQADLVVLAIGENVAPLETEAARASFRTGLDRLLGKIATDRKATLVVRSCFWPDATKDRILAEACKRAGGRWVDVGALGAVEANAARSERTFAHAGVGGHPGDRGMKAIADAIIAGLFAERRGD